MIKDILFSSIAVFFKKDKVHNKPRVIQVEPTTYCNLKCKMCIRNDKVIEPHHMEEKTLHLAVKKLSPEQIVFSGSGEPLQNPHLPEMLNFCSKLKIRTMITTNLVSEKQVIDKILGAGINEITVSIDAPDRNTYAAIRGKADCFDTIIDNVRYINSIKKHFTDLGFEYVIMKENHAKIPAMIDLAHSLNVNRIYFRKLQTEGIKEERRKDLIGNFDLMNLKDILKIANLKASKLKIKTNLRELLVNFNDIVDIYSREVSPESGASCSLPWLQIFIAANGDVSPCSALYTNSNVKSGNIIEHSRDEILNGPAMVCIRRGFKNKKLAPVCRDCIPRDSGRLFNLIRSFS